MSPMAETDDVLRVLHDQLLANKPAAGTHDAASCAFCTPSQPSPGGAVVTAPNLTQADLDAAVEAAVASLRKEVTELRASQEAEAIAASTAAAVATATEPLAAQVTQLQTDLDAAKLEAVAEKARADTSEAAQAEAVRAGEVAARRDERLKAVAAAAPGFDEAYLAANADRWAEMADDEFATRIEDYAAATKAIPTTGNGPLPTATALTAAASDAGVPRGARTGSSALRELSVLQRTQGFDARRI